MTTTQTPLRLTDHDKPVLALISPAQRDFLQDLRHDLRGRPFWGKVRVQVQNGEPTGSSEIQEETRKYGG